MMPYPPRVATMRIPDRILFGFLLSAAAMACNGKDGDADDSAPPVDIVPISCHKTDPVIDQVSVANTGLQKRNKVEVPTWTVSLHVTDEDGELSDYDIFVSFDDKLDGKVEPNSFNTFVKNVENAGDSCTVTEQTVDYVLAVNEEYLLYDTHYELGVVVVDNGDGESNMAVTDGFTPKKDGSDGG
jgi:hypothetical protein